MKILVGSEALRYWYPDFRESKDVDYFSDVKLSGEEDGKRIESFWHPAIEENLETILKYCMEKPCAQDGCCVDTYIAKPDFLYTLKVSHSFWVQRNGSWNKHMSDILWMQRNTDVSFVQELYDIFYPIWEERYGKKRAKLNVDAKDFFKSTIDRKYDHDSVHASVAYYDRPLFNEILKDGEQVAVSKEKFFNLSHEKKLQLVREECYATALERMVIPSNYTYNPRRAYRWALMKTITSFSKGWFPLWIVQHFNEVCSPDVDYVARHKENSDRLISL